MDASILHCRWLSTLWVIRVAHLLGLVSLRDQKVPSRALFGKYHTQTTVDHTLELRKPIVWECDSGCSASSDASDTLEIASVTQLDWTLAECWNSLSCLLLRQVLCLIVSMEDGELLALRLRAGIKICPPPASSAPLK